MDYRNLLTDNEIKMITNLREHIGDNYSSQAPVDTNTWLNAWNDAKNISCNIIFKDKLIFTKKINYKKSEDELLEEISRWRYKENNDFFERFSDTVCKPIENKYRELDAARYWSIYNLISDSCLASNIYDGDNYTISLPNGKDFYLNTGCKVSRAIGKLASAFGIDGWEPIRISISRVLNQKDITGTLCLSIHPLDYLTASYNHSNWGSCMDIYEGDYRRGVIEMMNSHMVITAYLINDHNPTMNFEDGVWNNKRWREFFIFTPELTCGIKGYPYWNRELETIVLDWIRELSANEINWESTLYKYEPDGGSENQHQLTFVCGPAMYCDVYGGNEYYYYISDKFNTNEYYEFFYSGLSECAVCGGECESDDDCHSVTCEDCFERVHCDMCNDKYPIDELVEFRGCHLCSGCYDSLPACECCNDINFEEDMIYVPYLGKKINDHHALLIEQSICFCRDCYTKIFKKDTKIETIVSDATADDKDRLWYYPSVYNFIDINNIKDKDYFCLDMFYDEDNATSIDRRRKYISGEFNKSYNPW